MAYQRVVLWGLVPFLLNVACAKPAGLVVLLPHPETGEVGGATVSAGEATVELTEAGQGTRVRAGEQPTTPAPVPPAEVGRVFGAALAARAPAPVQFLLYFELGEEQLTRESERSVPDIVEEMRRRPILDITIIGHTDRTGTEEFNMALGMRRAVLVRDLLVAAGVDPALMELASHGEADLLVPTEDEVPEPRNRRVEVMIR
jgi:outer membrane protein OmpA-like peptidoglycan-associated protein